MVAPQVEKGYTVEGQGAWWAAPDSETTPELRGRQAVEVYDMMRRQDAQVMSVLRAVTLPIRRTAWRLNPSGARPEVAQLVADDLGLPVQGQEDAAVLRTRDRFSWTDHLRLALLMLPFGHSYFEQQYRVINGQARLKKLAWRPPRTIDDIKVAADGGLIGIHQVAMKANELIPVTQLVAYVHDREGGNWRGQSLLRPAYKDWMLKDRKLRTQQQTIDRNGLGIPVYTAAEQPEDVTGTERMTRESDEVEDGKAVVKSLRSGDDAGVSKPAGSKLELMGVTGTLPDTIAPIRYHDEQIARAVLAHFLNLGTETGSWALGSTFADFFTLSLQTVAMAVADIANQHIVEDLVDLNFGDSEPAPKIVFDEIGSRHPATAEAIKMLIECGAIKADDHLDAYIRTTYGLPAADPSTAREPPRKSTLQGEAA